MQCNSVTLRFGVHVIANVCAWRYDVTHGYVAVLLLHDELELALGEALHRRRALLEDLDELLRQIVADVDAVRLDLRRKLVRRCEGMVA